MGGVSDETSAPTNVNAGDKIAGYRLEERIGQGGMAVVYRAHDERLDRRVALKLLAPGLAADTAFRTRFIRESRAAAAVDHPNIIPVYDAGDAGGFLFIAMRYVQGGDVRSLFSAGQKLPASRVWNIISQVGAALDAAHAHDLIHRDVKPANILLDAGGRGTSGPQPTRSGEENDHVYLSDFGISKQTLASHLTSTGQFVGTLDYIAPEQIEAQTVDGRVDQYSLACATYEMLTSEPPFRRDLGLALINAHLSSPPPSLLSKRPDLPPAAEQVIARAMSKSPAQRYASCTDFATNLGRALRLVPGPPDVGGLPPVRGEAAGSDQPKPWPATELADAGALAAAGGAAATNQPATNQPPAGQQWPAGTPGSFDEATRLSGPQGSGQPATHQPAAQQPQQQQQAGWQQGYTPPQGTWQPGQTPPQGTWQQGTWQQGQQQGQYPQGQYPQGQFPGQQFQQAQPGQYQQGQPQQGQPQQGQAQQGQAQQNAWATGSGQGGGYGQYPQQTGWPGAQGQNWQQNQPPRKSNKGLAVLVAIAAIVIIGGGGTFAYLHFSHSTASSQVRHTTGPTSPTTPSASSSSTPSDNSSATATTQAANLTNLLGTSTQTHTSLQSAVLDIEDNCSSLSSDEIANDVAAIQSADNQRQSEYDSAKSLDISDLQNATTLKSDLMSALQYSLAADNNFLTWAQQEQGGCFPSNESTAYETATNDSTTASADKQAFANVWNPEAPTYGQPQVTPGDI